MRVFTTPGGHPHPQSSLIHAQRNGDSATNARKGAGQPCPAPTRPPSAHRARRTTAHTFQAHTRGVNTNQASGAGADAATLSHHPKQARQHQSTQTPKGEHAPRVNTKPSHPPSKHAHNKPQQGTPQANTKSAHATARGQARCVSAGGPACPGRGDRHEAKQGETPTRAGTQDKRTQGERANNVVCAEAVPPCARQTGVRRERKAAHNSPRQSAWVVVFVGVFADVCRRFWAGWFGGLGVFWGCLACFLVF